VSALLARLVAWLVGPETLNCTVCGKLCHRHEPGCTVPPGEIEER
jgi:hypothetical protein